MNSQKPQMMVPLTPAVKWIIIITVGVWFVGQVLLETFLRVRLSPWLALYPDKVIFNFEYKYVFFTRKSLCLKIIQLHNL